MVRVSLWAGLGMYALAHFACASPAAPFEGVLVADIEQQRDTNAKAHTTTSTTKSRTSSRKTKKTRTKTHSATPTPTAAAGSCESDELSGPTYTSDGSTYELSCGFALASTNLGSIQAKTFNDCFAHCDSTAQCEAFTFFQHGNGKGGTSGLGTCSFSSSGTPLNANGKSDSAVVQSS